MLRRSIFAMLAVLGSAAAAHAQAVTKTIDLGIGANGTYWRIWWVNVNLEAGKLTFGVKGYVDRPTWLAGKGALAERQFVMDIPGGAGTLTWNQLIAAMQAFVKTATNANGVVEFSGAADAT